MELKDILDKLSSYNIFNYLLPGAVFCVFASKISDLSLIQSELLTGFFVYYFVGVIISRIGSLFVEPPLKYLKFIKFSDYGKFIEKSKEDPKIEILSETNNMYRTLCALILSLFSLKLFDYLCSLSTWLEQNKVEVVLSILLIMFLFSYRKQTQYITKRVER